MTSIISTWLIVTHINCLASEEAHIGNPAGQLPHWEQCDRTCPWWHMTHQTRYPPYMVIHIPVVSNWGLRSTSTGNMGDLDYCCQLWMQHRSVYNSLSEQFKKLWDDKVCGVHGIKPLATHLYFGTRARTSYQCLYTHFQFIWWIHNALSLSWH